MKDHVTNEANEAITKPSNEPPRPPDVPNPVGNYIEYEGGDKIPIWFNIMAFLAFATVFVMTIFLIVGS